MWCMKVEKCFCDDLYFNVNNIRYLFSLDLVNCNWVLFKLCFVNLLCEKFFKGNRWLNYIFCLNEVDICLSD